MNRLYNDKKIVRKFHLPLNYNAPPLPHLQLQTRQGIKKYKYKYV